MCFGEYFFEVYLFGDLWASSIWMLKSLARLGKFSRIILLNKFSNTLASSLPSGTSKIRVFGHLMMSHISHGLCLLLFIYFSFYLSDLVILKTCLQIVTFSLLLDLVYCWRFWMYFVFHFLVPCFLFISFFMTSICLVNFSFISRISFLFFLLSFSIFL